VGHISQKNNKLHRNYMQVSYSGHAPKCTFSRNMGVGFPKRLPALFGAHELVSSPSLYETIVRIPYWSRMLHTVVKAWILGPWIL